MNTLDTKKEMIKRKKEDLPLRIIEIGLNALFIESIDVCERIKDGLKKIDIVNDIETLQNIKDEATVLIDIREREYNEKLDIIAFAKQLNKDLCVIAKDLIIEEYQVYLGRAYRVDSLMFDISHLAAEELKNIMFIAESMGITPILNINSEADISKIDWEVTRIVAPKDKDLLEKIPNEIKLVKDVDANFDSADVVIQGE